MRLGVKQKQHLLTLISEGLETDEINKAAKKFKPSYQVSRSQVDFYRKTRAVKLEEIKDDGERSALKKGFALRENRVASLDKVLTKIEAELLDERGLWLDDAKLLGTGRSAKVVRFSRFNAAQVSAYRGLHDDIAKEMGDRRQKHEVTINPRKALAELLGVPEDDLPADSATDDVKP